MRSHKALERQQKREVSRRKRRKSYKVRGMPLSPSGSAYDRGQKTFQRIVESLWWSRK